MKNKKKIIQIAKLMFQNSLTGGFLDNKKIMSNLNILTSQKPQGLVNILRLYKRLIGQAQSLEELDIESAEVLNSAQEKDLISKTGVRKINYKLNPKMVFGAKIKHGDWIYEQSLESKLEQMSGGNQDIR